MPHPRITVGVLVGLALALCGCTILSPVTPTPPPPTPAAELILYAWTESVPQSVLEAFTAETGVPFRYMTYESQEEAAAAIRAGLEYDIVLLPPEFISELIAEDRLAPIDFSRVPNHTNVSASFRELAYDPLNRYSIVFHWGTTGLLVRTDLVDEAVGHWSDLWDPRFAGRVAMWPISSGAIPIALKSLGYDANTVNPEALEAALQHLLALKPNAIWIDNRDPSIVPYLVSGEAVLAYGWAYDAQIASEQSVPIRYIIPAEGTFLWIESFVIPASSRHKATAEAFLDFVLRPEMSARIVDEGYYAVANDEARSLVAPDIANNPAIYPSAEQLRAATVVIPFDAEGNNLFAPIWSRFMAGDE